MSLSLRVPTLGESPIVSSHDYYDIPYTPWWRREFPRPFTGKSVLVVNVASKCGLTPQYEGLENLQKTYADKGLASWASRAINSWVKNRHRRGDPNVRSTTYGVTFPLFEKIDVNGDERSPIYAELTKVADAEGYSGDVRWTLEKFLVSPDGTVQRFAPQVTPEDPVLVSAIESSLP